MQIKLLGNRKFLMRARFRLQPHWFIENLIEQTHVQTDAPPNRVGFGSYPGSCNQLHGGVERAGRQLASPPALTANKHSQ
jgi:hypothetical protein